MKSIRFGTFLVEAGVLSRADLLAALRIQQGRQLSLSDLAASQGLLTGDDLEQVWRGMNEDPGSTFEECAVSCGKIDSGTIIKLIAEQKKTRPKLGQLLIELGLISGEDQLSGLLAEFSNFNGPHGA